MHELPSESIDLTVYSPPFAGLYQYSSDPADLSNSKNFDEFMDHYAHAIREIHRVTMPGRMTAVHCQDIPILRPKDHHLTDFPGDIIRLHTKLGWKYCARYHVWKEPLTVRNRTMVNSLHHKTLCEDSTRTSIANADYLLMFRRKGENEIPVRYETGMKTYAGEDQPPAELLRFRGMEGDQKKNQYSQYIWRRYASSVWMDIRIDRVLPHREAKDDQDEKHVHPLQLDVIERCVSMWSNPGEVVLTPFMGVGSEVYGALNNNRRAIGIELKTAYYKQAKKNVATLQTDDAQESLSMEIELFDEELSEAPQ
jgi:DNA modification methylase